MSALGRKLTLASVVEALSQLSHFGSKPILEEGAQSLDFGVFVTVIVRKARSALARTQHHMITLALDTQNPDHFIIYRSASGAYPKIEDVAAGQNQIA